MRTIRATDLCFNGIRTIADREGISMASVIERMLTYPCNVCGQLCFPDSEEEFKIFSTGKSKAFKETSWGHASCHKKAKKET